MALPLRLRPHVGALAPPAPAREDIPQAPDTGALYLPFPAGPHAQSAQVGPPPPPVLPSTVVQVSSARLVRPSRPEQGPEDQNQRYQQGHTTGYYSLAHYCGGHVMVLAYRTFLFFHQYT